MNKQTMQTALTWAEHIKEYVFSPSTVLTVLILTGFLPINILTILIWIAVPIMQGTLNGFIKSLKRALDTHA